MRVVLAIGDAGSVIAGSKSAGEAELLRIAQARRDRLGGVASLVRAGLTDERNGGIAAIRAQFDEAVALAPEAAVALYSLGSAEILDRATDEIVSRLREWRLARRRMRTCSISAAASAGSSARCRPHVALDHRDRCLAGHDRRGAGAVPRSRQCRVSCCVDGRDLAGFRRKAVRPGARGRCVSVSGGGRSRRSRRGMCGRRPDLLRAGRRAGDPQLFLSRRSRGRPRATSRGSRPRTASRSNATARAISSLWDGRRSCCASPDGRAVSAARRG